MRFTTALPARLAASAAAIGATLALAPAAGAHHAVATADVDLKIHGKLKSGARRVTLNWRLGCGPGDGALENARVAIYLRDRRGKERRYYEPEPRYLREGDASVKTFLAAGGEFVARASADCTLYTDDHRDSASDRSRIVRFAPALTGFSHATQSTCGVRGHVRPTDFQQGMGSTITLDATFYTRLFMKRPKSTREMRVHFRGAGMPRSVRPWQWDWRRTREIAVTVKPKRYGRARMWLTIGGVRTNKLRFRVLKLPRGCRGL